MSEEPTRFVVPKGKVVVFRFVGGVRDGDESRTDGPGESGLAKEAHAYWWVTKAGTLGEGILTTSPRGIDILLNDGLEAACKEFSGEIPQYVYQVVDKQEAESEIVVTLEHRGLLSDLLARLKEQNSKPTEPDE